MSRRIFIHIISH